MESCLGAVAKALVSFHNLILDLWMNCAAINRATVSVLDVELQQLVLVSCKTRCLCTRDRSWQPRSWHKIKHSTIRRKECLHPLLQDSRPTPTVIKQAIGYTTLHSSTSYVSHVNISGFPEASKLLWSWSISSHGSRISLENPT